MTKNPKAMPSLDVLLASHSLPVDDWFASIADLLLNGTELVVNNQTHRLIEVEFYLHAPGHADPFSHRHPTQKELGTWYLHRTGGGFRGGSFKGLDITFGNSCSHAGILLRGIKTSSGVIVDGPSLLVDYLLQATNSQRVENLDRLVGSNRVWDRNSPMALIPTKNPARKPLLRSARVGLSFKRSVICENAESLDFVKRRYRWLSEPRLTRKGKPQMTIGMYLDGLTCEEIAEKIGCSARIVQYHIDEFEEGLKESDPCRYFGKELKITEFCRFLGVIHRNERDG